MTLEELEDTIYVLLNYQLAKDIVEPLLTEIMKLIQEYIDEWYSN